MTEVAMRRAIARKRDGSELDAATWRGVVAGFLDGEVDDAQLAALFMACVVRGMTFEETYALTAAFIDSGETLAAPDPLTVDKHSSGGVGDTASLIVVPLVASCGVPVAKMSGRALGHTGGTLDKLEAIPGVRTDLSPERFFACVASVGCAIAAQSARLVPADQRTYALRDRTATVPSLGLIAASIVSKKIAAGARAVAFDVKVGGGAFMGDVAQARALADVLVTLTRAFGPRAHALISDMHEPLGPAIGTGLEACEARDYLRGTRRDPRLEAVCTALSRDMLALAGFEGDVERTLARNLASGRAYEMFERMLAAQGARPAALDALRPHREAGVVCAERSGYVGEIAAVALGEAARELIARRGSMAGIVLARRVGDAVRRGEPLATVYGEARYSGDVASAFVIRHEPPAPRPLLYGETRTPIVEDAAGNGGSMRSGGAGPRSTLDKR